MRAPARFAKVSLVMTDHPRNLPADREQPPSRAAPTPLADAQEGAPVRVTPMMAQYIEIKAANPGCLLFYRMGDFYELFFDDAEIASRALGIVLTKRGKHQGEDIPMCGVPIERSDDYLHRLIGLGHRVAVCEQIEDPAEARKRGPKSVVRRDVVRLVTAGTITEERLLDPGRANVLTALARVKATHGWTYGLAAVDISTGDFSLCETDLAGLPALLSRLEPREIVAAEPICADPALARLLDDSGAVVAPLGRESADPAGMERRICAFYGVAALESFGALSRAEIAAAAAAIFYIERTQFAAKPRLARPARLGQGLAMEIDAATRANLELTRTLTGQREGSLLAAIDRTATPAGARLLAERLGAPLLDPKAIAARLDSVEFFRGDQPTRDDLRRRLKAAPDMARALGRLALGRGGPRDLLALGEGLSGAKACGAALQALDPPDLLARAAHILASVDLELARHFSIALVDDPPLDRRDGGFVRAGFEPALDETRALRDESRRVIAALQQLYCERTHIKQLKIKHNNFLGFFIETPQVHGEKLLSAHKDMFIHRQTMADAMRFSTSELAELDARIASAAEQALDLERKIFDDLAARALAASDAIAAAARALAELDCFAALADLAVRLDWSRPQIDASLAFVIEGARHPVVEAALRARGDAFVANDCDLSGETDGGRIAIVTGPNMAGKSTFLRQNALIAILAQTGSFVPARSARIGVVDRLFSRVGAADDLARGRSTFMVEMVETAAILNQASARSLVILDEIGRGTATFDGLSIAWAVMEHLHEKNRARTLFATHFHELTQLAQKWPRLINLSMRVSDWNGDVVFLHEVVSGAADRSYGVQVAKLAGLPETAVARARQILAELEATDRQAPIERLVADLPLFARPAPASVPAPASDPLLERLDALQPDEMTPLQALEALYALKKARREAN